MDHPGGKTNSNGPPPGGKPWALGLFLRTASCILRTRSSFSSNSCSKRSAKVGPTLNRDESSGDAFWVSSQSFGSDWIEQVVTTIDIKLTQNNKQQTRFEKSPPNVKRNRHKGTHKSSCFIFRSSNYIQSPMPSCVFLHKKTCDLRIPTKII